MLLYVQYANVVSIMESQVTKLNLTYHMSIYSFAFCFEHISFLKIRTKSPKIRPPRAVGQTQDQPQATAATRTDAKPEVGSCPAPAQREAQGMVDA